MNRFLVVFLSILLIFFTACTDSKKPGGILNVMIESEVMTLDPTQTIDITTFEFIANFTDGLKQMDDDGATVNAICKNEKVSKDGLVYTFELRDDANWSNGDPVTADDFVYGWQRAIDPKTASVYAFMLSDIGQIKNASKIVSGLLPVEELGVRALGEKTLEVTLEVPVAFFDDLLYFPIFYPVNRTFAKKCGDSYATSADSVLSNGAFQITEFKPGSLSYSLRKNPYYYDAEKIKLDGLNYKVYTDPEKAHLSYCNDELDVIKLSGVQVAALKSEDEFLSFGAGKLCYISLMIKNVPELQNRNFRRAITFAINRQKIVEDILKDGSLACYSLVPSQVVFNEKGKDFSLRKTEFHEYCSYKPARGLEFFDLAKKELGKNEFELELLVEEAPLQQKIAETIKRQLEENLKGLKIKIHVETKKNRNTLLDAGLYQMGITRWGPDYADPMTYLGLWETNNPNNYGRWSDVAYDSIIKACTSGDYARMPSERWVALKTAEKFIMQEAAVIPLFQQSDSYLVKKNVKGLSFHAIAIRCSYKGAFKK